MQTEGPTVERAWKVVNYVFEETAPHVADSDKGRLWRPIKKMMNRAQEVRKKHLEEEEEAARVSSLSTERAAFSMAETVLWPNPQFSNQKTMEIGTESKLLNASGFEQQPGTSSEQRSINWDQWLATGGADSMDYNDEMNQMAWTNWETFIDDFHVSADFLPGQEGGIPSFNL